MLTVNRLTTCVKPRGVCSINLYIWSMKFSAQKIAQLIDGKVVGDENAEVSNLSKIEEGSPGTLSFHANPAYAEYIYSTRASIVIVSEDFRPERDLPEGLTMIRVKDPYAGFAKLLEAYNELKQDRVGVAKGAIVEPGATLGEKVYIGHGAVVETGAVIGDNAKIYPGCYIGDGVKIGAGTVLHPGARILSRCEIGAHCVIHPGVVIGGDGFGFAPNSEHNYSKVPQIGNVVVEDHVEIGANSTIDRATLGHTIIRRGVKIDNLIQIAHNVEIGENTVIAAQTGIAGSTKIGKNCMIGGQVGIIGHLTIADGTKIAAQSGIGSSIKEPDTIIQGSPAFGIGEFKRSYIGFRRLPALLKEVSDLRKELEAQKSNTSI